ncbi:hypothetical protein LTS10_001307 [Elasticomyces elasticus]|nr:hypothetical protein LTS10_001307 [Elasticomyces elasticus]
MGFTRISRTRSSNSNIEWTARKISHEDVVLAVETTPLLAHGGPRSPAESRLHELIAKPSLMRRSANFLARIFRVGGVRRAGEPDLEAASVISSTCSTCESDDDDNDTVVPPKSRIRRWRTAASTRCLDVLRRAREIFVGAESTWGNWVLAVIALSAWLLFGGLFITTQAMFGLRWRRTGEELATQAVGLNSLR